MSICQKYPYLNICREEQKSFVSRDRVASGRQRTRTSLRPQPPPRRDITDVEVERPPPPRRDITDVEVERPPPPRRDTAPKDVRRTGTPQNTEAPDIRTQKFFKDTRRKFGKEREKFLKKLEMGTRIVEHQPEEILNAYLAEAAYRNAYESTNKAEKFVQSGKDLVPELEFMEVVRDPRFTNNEHIAFTNTQTGEHYLSYRGSDGDFFKPEANVESMMRGKGLRVKNAVDWGTNMYTIGGQEHKSKRYKGAVSVAREFAEFTGKEPIELNYTGHSLGGGQSDHVAETIGGKSFSFSPARNPLASRYKKAPHPSARIKSVSTIFDPVSLARNAHARMKGGEAPHIQHTNYTAVPSKEDNLIDAHNHFEQHLEGVYKDPTTGKLLSKRTTPLRNIASMIGGGGATRLGKISTSAGVLAGATIPLALEPEYDTKTEAAFRGTEATIDNLAVTAALSEQLYRLNPMFFLLDEPAMFATIMDFDLNLSPGDKHKIAKGLGIKIKDEPYRYKKPPKAIQAIQTAGRKRQEDEMAAVQRQADAYGITFAEASMLDIESDPGVPLREQHHESLFEKTAIKASGGQERADGGFEMPDGRVVYEVP